jgi:hypothetical protein
MPTQPLARATEPFQRATGIANVVRVLAVLADQLEAAAQSDDARSLLRACDARRCGATGLATTAALAVTPEAALAELRAELGTEDAVVRFDAALEAMRIIRAERPHAYVEAQAAVRDAQRAFADGAFAALDGAPCPIGGAFAAGHRSVAFWLRAAPDSIATQVVREARIDCDGGYWARLRSNAVDVSRFELSAAYRAGVTYAEQVLTSRGHL